jgi:hypothetical protein
MPARSCLARTLGWAPRPSHRQKPLKVQSKTRAAGFRLALTDVSRHRAIPAAAPQQADVTPRPLADAVGPGDNQKGMTELIAARGIVTRALHRSGFGATMTRHGRRFSS